MVEFNYEEQLKFRDKVALEVLKSMLINKMPSGNPEIIETQCIFAYKYADIFYQTRISTAPKCKSDDYVTME